MASLYQLLVVAALSATTLSASLKRGTKCPRAYHEISPQHTMCLEDVGTPVKLTRKDKRAAVEEHNKIRARVSPRAANMLRLEWDEDLAKVATKWAAQCNYDHDKIRLLPKLPGVWVGQNMAAGNMDLVQAIQFWETEISYFRYDKQPTGTVGHYTQIVNAKTALVGCGIANCPSGRHRKLQVCNYAAGQFTSALKKPYKKGSNGCDDCSDRCDSTGKLCDCKGKICLNGGQLNINTCTCDCSKLYTGSVCQEVNCYPDDKTCPRYAKFPGDVCSKYSNVPELCPHMCGVC